MSLVELFNNSNGRTYLVIEKFEVPNYWSNGESLTIALLKDTYQYVVAYCLEETSWGQGYYYENIEHAAEKYAELKESYVGVCV